MDYLDPTSINGLNIYAYCNNDPVNYCDPSGHFPILACILGITALIGMCLTIGGVASDNNIMTGIGLTFVAVPAFVSGGIAIAAGIGGATTVAGIFSGVFASAEYQEYAGSGNWIQDITGISDEIYNTLLISTAAVATIGTISCGILTSIGNSATPQQMFRSLNEHPRRWKVVKELVEPGIGKHKSGISTYSNYINKWTGGKIGTHRIIREGIFIHGPHIHPWI